MSEKVYVSVTEGKIQGTKKISNFSSTEYYCFLGIPYAQPPIGQARFKDPVKIKPWTGVFNGTIEKEGCRQFSLLTRKLAGSEDCLYNNIYTLQLPGKDQPLKPVIVCIHPGAFIYGSPDPKAFGSPEFVIHHDIVYVCVSFRLHILGFLNLGLPECSGNQGVKDIIMSLEWIRDNISSFGGDPNNVTVMGSSTGASITHILMLSPQAKSLFHKAVLMGMYVMCPALMTHRENVTTAFEMAKSLGYRGTAEDRKRLLSFYKKISIDALLLLKPISYTDQVRIPVYPAPPFLPIPESDSSENSILPLDPDQLSPSIARIPTMVGFCEQEAAMGFINAFRNKLEKNFYSTLTQNGYGWGNALTEEDLKKIQEQAELFYFNGEPTKNATLADKCEIQTDIALSDVYDSVVNIIAKDLPSSVYVYRFGFEGSIPTIKIRLAAQMDEPLKGTVHGDDYSYWAFIRDDGGMKMHHLTPKTREVIEKFTKLICSFAKKGDPNYEGLEVQWKPSSIENPYYLDIDNSLTVIEGKLNGKRMEFWENMKRKFSKHQVH